MWFNGNKTIFVVTRMNILFRISQAFVSRSSRSVALTAVAILSWTSGSHLPQAVLDRGTDFAVEGLVSSAAAAAGSAAPAADPKTGKTAEESAATLVNGVVELVMMLFLPATILAGWLLSPDWTFGEIFGLRPIIHDLWVLMSNVVYVIFAFLLVWLAFLNIFGQGHDHYAIKKALPRFVVGILIVPFTWFIVSGILSISNLLTASVLRLPADLLAQNVDGKNDKKEFTFKMPKECTLSFKKMSEGGKETASSSVTGKFFSCGKEMNELSFKDALAADKGAYGILNVYAYGIFRVQDFKELDKVNLKSVSSVIDMIINVGLWLLFLIVFAVLVLALTFALFTRAFYLWLIAILSPLFGLFYYLEGKGGFAEDLKKRVGLSTFISLALVPVYTAAALGFGLLFIKMAESAKLDPQNSSFFSKESTTNKETKDATFVMGPDGKASVITVKGVPVGMSEAASSAGDAAQGGVQLGASAIGKIIVGILALVILWMSVIAALSSSEITKEVIAPVASFGKSMGQLAMSMPKYAPIPIGGGKKMSMEGLSAFGSGIKSGADSAARGQWSNAGMDLGSSIG